MIGYFIYNEESTTNGQPSQRMEYNKHNGGLNTKRNIKDITQPNAQTDGVQLRSTQHQTNNYPKPKYTHIGVRIALSTGEKIGKKKLNQNRNFCSRSSSLASSCLAALTRHTLPPIVDQIHNRRSEPKVDESTWDSL